jgi:hypothetical protein
MKVVALISGNDILNILSIHCECLNKIKMIAKKLAKTEGGLGYL